ncbi:hypothetical protein BS78_K183800 [Paspalum vaginatum]|uniref:Uncharacterized protein n=1 Tax=Paspalum vaginatum TaxID=158149 RepID=A0A9W8CF95_9POAL|nr:hypothetical protein BS78_K183800 [Paspalum vaginatum]
MILRNFSLLVLRINHPHHSRSRPEFALLQGSSAATERADLVRGGHWQHEHPRHGRWEGDEEREERQSSKKARRGRVTGRRRRDPVAATAGVHASLRARDLLQERAREGGAGWRLAVEVREGGGAGAGGCVERRGEPADGEEDWTTRVAYPAWPAAGKRGGVAEGGGRRWEGEDEVEPWKGRAVWFAGPVGRWGFFFLFYKTDFVFCIIIMM